MKPRNQLSNKLSASVLLLACADYLVFSILSISAGPIKASIISSVICGVVFVVYYSQIQSFSRKAILYTTLLWTFSSIYIVAISQLFLLDPFILKLLPSLVLLIMVPIFKAKYLQTKPIPTKSLIYHLKNNWGIYALNIILIASCLVFIKTIPFATATQNMSAAPDEVAHYNYNVKFLIENHRLPVAGQDDKSAYEMCNINTYKQGVCLYSYTVFPAANYIFSAATSNILNELFDISHIKGARFASLIWAVVALNFAYLVAFRLSRSRKIAWLISSITLLPQILFVGSYINQDIHSLAISILVIYALVRLVQEKDTLSIVVAGVFFGGLLPLAKYNYFILVPIVCALILYFVIRHVITIRTAAYTTLSSLASFLLISSFWFIRNIALYHDVIGQGYVRKLTDQIVPSQSALGLNIDSFQSMVDIKFFDYLFDSFFVAFGYMIHFLSPEAYLFIKALLVCGIVTYLFVVFKKTPRKDKRSMLIMILIGLMISLVISISLVFYNAVTYDPQAQGRYLFNVVGLFIAALATAYHVNKNVLPVILCIFIIIVFCYLAAVGVFLSHYSIN